MTLPKYLKTNQSGQVLVIFLLVLVIGLALVLSIASRTVTDIRQTTTSDESNRAYFAAESGIEDALKKIKGDPATIFRTMNSFAQRNIVRPIELREGKVRYELASTKEHHHFICKNCNEIQDISDCNISLLERKVELKKGVVISHHSLEFFGLCKNCKVLNQT